MRARGNWCRRPAGWSATLLHVAASAPRKLDDARVLRYRGDVHADWATSHRLGDPAFQGPVTALAIVEEESSGGVLTLFLYADGTVADEWQATLEDALEALEETDEFEGLQWAD